MRLSSPPSRAPKSLHLWTSSLLSSFRRRTLSLSVTRRSRSLPCHRRPTSRHSTAQGRRARPITQRGPGPYFPNSRPRLFGFTMRLFALPSLDRDDLIRHFASWFCSLATMLLRTISHAAMASRCSSRPSANPRKVPGVHHNRPSACGRGSCHTALNRATGYRMLSPCPASSFYRCCGPCARTSACGTP